LLKAGRHAVQEAAEAELATDRERALAAART